MKESINEAQPLSRHRVAEVMLRWLWFPFLLCYLELILRGQRGPMADATTVYALLFASAAGFMLTLLCGLFCEKVNRVLLFVFTALVCTVFSIQLVYHTIFGGYAPISAVGLGAQAITNFKAQLLVGIRDSLRPLGFLLLPFAFLCVAVPLAHLRLPRLRGLRVAVPPLCTVLICVGTVLTLRFNQTSYYSLYYLLQSKETATDTAVQNFGLTATFFQELRFMVFGASKADDEPVELNETVYDPAVYNVGSLDFKVLYDNAETDAQRALTAQVSARTPTEKNAYTGLCNGYNLVLFCAESFSPYLIDETRTPTLYRLANNGFVFRNFYNSFLNTTTNGEYTFCMGLMPDMSRTKTDASFNLSIQNYLPYCFGNLFSSAGAEAYAYHNYLGSFYFRTYTHANMGYTFKAVDSGLDIPLSWPSSDYDMLRASVGDYIGTGERFVSYYMTFSGHYQYDWNNLMSAKNRDAVEDLPYSEQVQAYIACNLELEKALSCLVEELEKSGEADRTVIVLTTDHYPYGLSDVSYNELAGKPVDTVFERYRSSFICYVPGLETPVVCDDYCSTVDILPTLLNLFGVPYESRLLAGDDILAPNAWHTAILSNQSFLRADMRLDAASLSFLYSEGVEADPAAEEAAVRAVNRRFDLSADILNQNYYAYAFGKEGANLTLPSDMGVYEDVDVFQQAHVSYTVSHGLLKPRTENKFGLYEDARMDDAVCALYRVAKTIGVADAADDGADETAAAFAWARACGVLKEQDADTAPESPVTTGDVAVLFYRAARVFGLTSSISAEQAEQVHAQYPDTSRETVCAFIECFDKDMMTGDGTGIGYLFEHAENAFAYGALSSILHRFCTDVLQIPEQNTTEAP